LHAEWRKLSPTLNYEGRSGESEVETGDGLEREARLWWTNLQLQRRGRQGAPIRSWNDLTAHEARRLLKMMREESGSGPAYRGQLIARLAVELWGSDWDSILRERLQQRFGVNRLDELTPRQARAMIEELKSRLARVTNPAGS
jgi:hypothetical protein